MANIIFSVSSCIGVPWQKETYNDSFTQEFINALISAGNNVLDIKCNEFKRGLPRHRLDINYNKINKKIKDFKPDLIITFNNSLVNEDTLKYTNCPVACFSADSPAYFYNAKLIKKYQDRYYFLHFSPDIQTSIKNWFPFIKDERNLLFGIATDFQRIEKEQDINVNFVGSMAIWDKSIPNYFQKIFAFNCIAKQLNLQKSYDIDKLKNELISKIEEFKHSPLDKISIDLPDFDDRKFNQSMIYLLTSHMRQEICHALSDIGLEIFTITSNFEDFILYGIDIFKCLNTRPVYLLEDLSDVYNRSKISLNMPNIQAVNGFSWRVYNILASQSIVLTNKKQYMTDLLKGYAKLPMYESAAEARDLAKIFLKDTIYRKELVLGCNKFIEEKCRFKDKFKFLSEIFDLELNNDNTGTYERINRDDYSYLPKFYIETKRNQKMRVAIKNLKLKKPMH